MVEEFQSGYYRDLQKGMAGEDVGNAQRLLISLGYQIDQQERDSQTYGESTEDAKKRLQRDLSENPLKMLEVILRLLFGDEKTRDALNDGLDALLQTSGEDIEEEIGVHGDSPFDTSGLGRNDDVLGTGKAVSLNGVKQLDYIGLVHLSDHIEGATAGDRAANLAKAFLGQHEGRGNSGPLVQLVNGDAGDAWCGSFVHYILDQTMPHVYDQGSFRSARSYVAVGKDHQAFHERGDDSYTPKAGDVITFARGNNPAQGHVGIVTDYDPATHTLTYISGNDGNAVRERTIDMAHPPSRLLGFTDSEAVARDRGIALSTNPIQARLNPEKPGKVAAVVPVIKHPKLGDVPHLAKHGIAQVAMDEANSALRHAKQFLQQHGLFV